jgi:hypothetical protein
MPPGLHTIERSMRWQKRRPWGDRPAGQKRVSRAAPPYRQSDLQPDPLDGRPRRSRARAHQAGQKTLDKTGPDLSFARALHRTVSVSCEAKCRISLPSLSKKRGSVARTGCSVTRFAFWQRRHRQLDLAQSPLSALLFIFSAEETPAQLRLASIAPCGGSTSLKDNQKTNADCHFQPREP